MYDNNNNIQNILINNQNKLNKNEIFEMKQTKENDILLKPNIPKVDEGINALMQNSSLKKYYKNENIKNNRIAKYEIMENESLSIINNNKNNEKDRNNKILSTDYKVGNQFSIYFNISDIPNNAKKDIIQNTENKNKNKKILKENIRTNTKLLTQKKIYPKLNLYTNKKKKL